jgi:hypothetical protein
MDFLCIWSIIIILTIVVLLISIVILIICILHSIVIFLMLINLLDLAINGTQRLRNLSDVIFETSLLSFDLNLLLFFYVSLFDGVLCDITLIIISLRSKHLLLLLLLLALTW